MFEKIKRFYQEGLYTKAQVKKFLDKGVITEEQYIEIVEVVKKDDSKMQNGDYTNPILIPEQGIIIVKGLWYYVTDKDLPHEALFDAFVTRDDFNDKRWFDFV